MRFVREDLQQLRVAGEIDRAHPHLEERFQSLAEVSNTSAGASCQTANHPALARRLAYESEKLAPAVRPRQVVPTRRLSLPLVVLAATSALLLAGLLADRMLTTFLLRRFWSPWTAITMTNLEGVPDRVVTPRGESTTLAVGVAGRVPATARIEFREPDGEIVAHTVSVGAAEARFHLASLEQSVDFRWQAGDAETDWTPLVAVDRPRLTQVRFIATPPEYTGRSAEQRAALPEHTVLVEGSRLELAFHADQPLEVFHLEFADKSTIALEPDALGWRRWSAIVTGDFEFSCRMISEEGLENLYPPRCRVTVHRDQSPRVKILSPTPDTAVNSEDEVKIVLEAHDDIAIVRGELVVYDERPGASDEPLLVIPIDLGEQAGKQDVRASVSLPLKDFDLANGEAISYAIRVFDNRQAPPLITPGDENSLSTSPSIEEKPVAGDTADHANVEPSEEARGSRSSSPTTTSPADSTSSDGRASNPSTADADAPPAVPQQPTPRNSPTPLAETTADRNSTETGRETSTTTSQLPSEGAASPPSGKQEANEDPTESTPQADANPERADTPKETPPEDASSSSASARVPEPLGPRSPEQPTDKASQPGATSAKPSDSSPQNSGSQQAGGSSPKSDKPATDTPQKDRPSETTEKRANQAGPSPQEPARPGPVSMPPGVTPPKTPMSSQAGSPSPPNPMSQRFLDVPQATTSEQRLLRVDEYAGSFEGQQREKLAIAIAPVLYGLDERLREAEEHAGGVVERMKGRSSPRPADKELLDEADRLLAQAQQAVADLRQRTDDTVYAFIGVQLDSIVSVHVAPARKSLWESQAASRGSREAVRSAWQEIRRARQRLGELTASFDRIRRDHRLAEQTDKIKKMYRVFVEGSLPQLEKSWERINNYERRPEEFELDEEYLERLREVLEMRNELRAELARMLQDDPRLARRFMDNAARRAESLRDQVTLLAERQKRLGREVQAWERAGDKRPIVLAAIRQRRWRRLDEISQQTAELNERITTWLPLDISAEDPLLSESLQQGKAAAATAAELTASDWQADPAGIARPLLDRLRKLEGALRRLGAEANDSAASNYVTRRRAEARRLAKRVESWQRQANLLHRGQFAPEAAIEQNQLSLETDTLATKLANLEAQLTAGLRPDREFKERVHTTTERALQTLDVDITANQLAAAFALRSNQLPKALKKEIAAVAAFDRLEELLDQVFRSVLDELDKLPSEDPIASLLDDPTLDELLAQLENEFDFAEELGIPLRNSNLQIMQDWVRRGQGNQAGSSITAFLRQQADRNRRRAERANRAAIDRVLGLQKKLLEEARAALETHERTEWNNLLSTVPDSLRQGRGEAPPEQYRRMIEEYFSIISRLRHESAGSARPVTGAQSPSTN